MAAPPPPPARPRLAVIYVTAAVLFAGGVFLLFFASRVALPLRLALGCADLIAAIVLLGFARQQARRR